MLTSIRKLLQVRYLTVGACLLSGLRAAAAQSVISAFAPDPSLSRVAERAIAADEVLVAVNLRQLAAARIGDRIAFEMLVSGAVIRVSNAQKHGPGAFSLTGTLDSDPESLFAVSVYQDAIAGVFHDWKAGAHYRFRYVGGGAHVLAPIGPTDDECGVTEALQLSDAANEDSVAPKPSVSPTAASRGCASPARMFDVLVYYTPAASTANGGTNATVALAQLAGTLANQAYSDSDVSARMLIVDARQITYTESGSLETDRNRLRDPSDGVMDGVHAARDAIGADFVCLLVSESDVDLAGIAYCTPNASRGFCVVEEDDIDDGSHSFTHEVGHLQGCAHNHGDAGAGCNRFCYSFGRRFTGLSGTGWRTIMAYDDAGNNFSNRIPRFSNPSQTWDGLSLGVDTSPCGVFPSNDDADNARSIDENAATVEAFRDPAMNVWVDGTYSGTEHGTWAEPWSTLTAGISAIYADANAPLVTPTLNVKSDTYTATPTISTPMRIEACGGTVRIGT